MQICKTGTVKHDIMPSPQAVAVGKDQASRAEYHVHLPHDCPNQIAVVMQSNAHCCQCSSHGDETRAVLASAHCSWHLQCRDRTLWLAASRRGAASGAVCMRARLPAGEPCRPCCPSASISCTHMTRLQQHSHHCHVPHALVIVHLDPSIDAIRPISGQQASA